MSLCLSVRPSVCLSVRHKFVYSSESSSLLSPIDPIGLSQVSLRSVSGQSQGSLCLLHQTDGA